MNRRSPPGQTQYVRDASSPRRAGQEGSKPRLVSTLLSTWVIVSACLLAVLLAGATLAVIWLTRPQAAPTSPATAVFYMIPAPTFTQPPPTAAPTATTNPTPSLQLPPAPAPGVIAVGENVQITGTGGDGLRLRSAPGLQGDVLVLGAESEVFRVNDGPRDADGLTWWYLVGLYDASRHGWAVSNFLAVVKNP
jgi:hypothetical protein